MVDCGRSEALLRRGRVSVACALLVLGGLILLRHDLSKAPLPSRVARVMSASLMARLPVVFEPNMGQASNGVKFVASGASGSPCASLPLDTGPSRFHVVPPSTDLNNPLPACPNSAAKLLVCTASSWVASTLGCVCEVWPSETVAVTSIWFRSIPASANARRH